MANQGGAGAAAPQNLIHDRNIKLQSFDGTPSNALVWIKHIDMCQKAANWNSEQTAERARLHLTGEALTWIHNRIDAGTPGLDTWWPAEVNNVRPPGLKALMKARFVPGTDGRDAFSREALQQMPNQSVNAFYDQVEAAQFLMDDIFPENFKVGQKASYDLVHDKLVRTEFIQGLLPEIRKQVIARKPISAEEARQLAVNFEYADGGMKNTRKSFNVAALSDDMAKMSTSQWNRDVENEGCRYCGFIGHYKRECNLRLKDEANGQFLQQSPYFKPNQRGRGSGRYRSPRGRSSYRGQGHFQRTPWDPNNSRGQWRPQYPNRGYNGQNQRQLRGGYAHAAQGRDERSNEGPHRTSNVYDDSYQSEVQRTAEGNNMGAFRFLPEN